MHRSEARDLTRCAECGAEIFLEVDRTYPLTPEAALCFDCATRRGGAYDELDDRWVRPPEVADLLARLG